jgi:rod shape-determining protein MreB
MTTKIGLDLGYANITLSNITADVYREPSVVLVDKASRKIISVGNKAVMTDSETVSDGMLVRPFRNGLLYSSEITKEVINDFIRIVKPSEKIRCIIGVPADFLPKQEQEIFKMLRDSGVDECYSVNRALAALIGAGYAPGISAISVNIGASSTEIAVIYKGKIIISKRESVGGELFDKAVKDYILEQGDMNVSLSVARTIKENLGAVWQGRESESVDIEGTLALTGSKVKMSISTEDVVGVFEKPLQELLLSVANVIKKIPVDYVSEIFENGIVLSGGGAEIYGLDKMMTRVYGISVRLANNPIDCVAKGLSRINAIIPIKMRINEANITAKLVKYYETKTKNKNSQVEIKNEEFRKEK